MKLALAQRRRQAFFKSPSSDGLVQRRLQHTHGRADLWHRSAIIEHPLSLEDAFRRELVPFDRLSLRPQVRMSEARPDSSPPEPTQCYTNSARNCGRVISSSVCTFK